MKHRKILFASVVLIAAAACQKPAEKPNYPIQGVPFNEVKIDDEFWLPKIETNRTVTIPASFAKCEEMGRRQVCDGNKSP